MDARSSSEDPLKEVAALQFLKTYGPHPNVIDVVEVRTKAFNWWMVLHQHYVTSVYPPPPCTG